MPVSLCKLHYDYIPIQVFSHGFPQNPSALAYDALQSLVAIGNETGTIRIYPLTMYIAATGVCRVHVYTLCLVLLVSTFHQ